jgi:7SK snRNA methylphosphate capping enzyme
VDVSQAAVTFHTQDWALDEALPPSQVGADDVVLALSVVKWIHLQHLDSGLARFFRKVAEAVKGGGHFVFEPQPWESYGKAVKKSKGELRERVEGLKVRPEGFGELICAAGFVLVEKVGAERGLKRELFVYRKV